MTRLFRDVEGASLCPRGSVVCIGAFDGLHLGHQALVGRAVERARALGVPAVALSFEPLPREFFAREALPPRLLLPRAKFEGLGRLGADLVGLLRFNAALAAMDARDFATRVLRDRQVRLDRERVEEFPVYLFAADGVSFDLTVMPRDALRQAPIDRADGRPMQRASLGALRELIAKDEIAIFESGAD